MLAKLTFLCRRFPIPANDIRDILSETVAELASLQFETDRVNFGPAAQNWPALEYSFDAKDFENHYGSVAGKWDGGIQDALSWTCAHQDLFNKFIYVLGKEGEWRYFGNPLPVDVCITRRNDIVHFPFHPVLARDLNFKITVAGEIAFDWHADDEYPQIVYVNNVSGHFRPDDWCAANLAGCLRDSLDLPDTTLVIAIANDGAHVSGMKLAEMKLR